MQFYKYICSSDPSHGCYTVATQASAHGKACLWPACSGSYEIVCYKGAGGRGGTWRRRHRSARCRDGRCCLRVPGGGRSASFVE